MKLGRILAIFRWSVFSLDVRIHFRIFLEGQTAPSRIRLTLIYMGADVLRPALLWFLPSSQIIFRQAKILDFLKFFVADARAKNKKEKKIYSLSEHFEIGVRKSPMHERVKGLSRQSRNRPQFPGSQFPSFEYPFNMVHQVLSIPEDSIYIFCSVFILEWKLVIFLWKKYFL